MDCEFLKLGRLLLSCSFLRCFSRGCPESESVGAVVRQEFDNIETLILSHTIYEMRSTFDKRVSKESNQLCR